MTDPAKMCFTCRKSGSNKFYNAQSCDSDKIPYLEKLKICVTPDLVEVDDMDMCWLCVKHLRISYKFRTTVLTSQEILQKSDSLGVDRIKEEAAECEDIKVYLGGGEGFFKSEIESDSFEKNGYSSGDSSAKSERKQSESINCEFCGAQFGKQWQLRKHQARVHNEIRKFLCTFCSKEFKQSYHLKEHMTSHTGEKNYTCPICDKKFQRLSSQRRHIKSHDAPPGHKTKRTPFLCTICGKSFPFSNGVQRHMRIHLGIKNFECNLCGRRFTQSTHLQVHMRTHTGEKPYICDTCGEKFSLKSCMLKHINNRHYSSKTLVEDLPIFYLHKDFDQA